MSNQNIMKYLKRILEFILFAITTQLILWQTGSPTTSWDNPTILPTDTTQLWLAAGDTELNIVAIFCQGGPSDVLKYSQQPKTSWRYLPDYNKYYQVHLHQSNTYNPGMFESTDPFTYTRAVAEVDNTSEILHRAVSYFKKRGKVVYIFGHSYGAYIIPHYLSTKSSRADKYIMCSGRIDDPAEVVEAHKQGMNGYYDHKNGGILVPTTKKNFSNYTAQEINYYKSKQLIKAAAGALSFSEGMKSVDLNNSIYVYSDTDSRVGKLTDAEIAFLKKKGVQVIKTKYEHGETIYGLVDAIRSGDLILGLNPRG